MKRIKENAENESAEIVRAAWDSFSDGKHSRLNIQEFEADLETHIDEILMTLRCGSFMPAGYIDKVIHDKKRRMLGKAPIFDHVTETAAMLPYEQSVYDRIVWQSPAVRPGLGNHAMFRFLRNDLYSSSQEEVMFNFTLDIHHYFPLMDHTILYHRIDRFFKPGHVRTLLYRVVDSYAQGVPLGIKVAQLFGMMYLSDFDRLCMVCFNIRGDPDKLAYWTSRYIEEMVATASEQYRHLLDRGSVYLAKRFRRFLEQGLKHYYRFVDNITIMHEDKVFLRIIRELVIVHLTRDYHCIPNRDYAIRPTYLGIRLCGYVFFHDHVEINKRNKHNLCVKAHKLFKADADEEEVRVRLSSSIGFMKHADTTNLLKTIGMEKSLGKIIKKRRIKAPFEGMTSDQKVPISEIVKENPDKMGGGKRQPLG